MKNTNDRTAHGFSAEILSLNALAGATPAGALAAARCGLMLLTERPARVVKTKPAQQKLLRDQEMHDASLVGAARLLVQLIEHETQDLTPGLLNDLIKAYNAQVMDDARSTYVTGKVQRAQASFWRLAHNTFQVHGHPSQFKGFTLTGTAGTMNTAQLPDLVWDSAAKVQAGMQRKIWKAVGDDAMTDHFPATPEAEKALKAAMIDVADPATYIKLLLLRRKAALASRFQKAAKTAPEAFAPAYQAAVRIARGEGTPEDVMTLGARQRVLVSAATVMGMLHPSLSMSEAVAATRNLTVTAPDKGALAEDLRKLFLPDVSQMALLFAREQKDRFAGRIEPAVTAFISNAMTALEQWRPWLPGPYRSLAEVLVSNAGPGALKDTAKEWLNLSGSLNDAEKRVHAIVVDTAKELLSSMVGQYTPEFVLATLNKRDVRLSNGELFNLELVAAHLEIWEQSKIGSLDIEVGQDDEGRGRPRLGDTIASPFDVDAALDAVIREEAMEGLDLTRRTMSELLEDEEEMPYIDTLGDDAAIEYLRARHGTNNVQLLRGLLTEARKIRAMRDEQRLEILRENGMLRADGTSPFTPAVVTPQARQAWNLSRRITRKPRVRAKVTISALLAAYKADRTPLRARLVTAQVIGDAYDMRKHRYESISKGLEQFFLARSMGAAQTHLIEEGRESIPMGLEDFTDVQVPGETARRLISHTDLHEAAGLTRTHLEAGDGISLNLVLDVARRVDDNTLKLRLRALHMKESEPVKPTVTVAESDLPDVSGIDADDFEFDEVAPGTPGAAEEFIADSPFTDEELAAMDEQVFGNTDMSDLEFPDAM